MTRRNLTVAVGILAASFLGGIVGQRVFPAGSALAQAAGQAQQTVTAERFELIDADGNVRAVLGASEDTAGLILCDTDGETRVALSVTEGTAAGLLLHDADGEARAGLNAADDGEPFLSLHDEDGQSRVIISAGRAAELSLMDADGDTRIMLQVANEAVLQMVDDPMIKMFNARGTNIWDAP